jgi:hypothetical protein
LLGNGDGTFQASNTVALGGTDGIGATAITVADFNNDGKPDVVVGNPNDYTELLLGNGDGTLDGTMLVLAERPGHLATSDLLGNGFPEIIEGVDSENLAVFLNISSAWTTSSTMTTPTQTTVVSSANPSVFGQQVIFTATVTSSGGTPSGIVTFLDSTTTVGSGTLNSSGIATFSSTSLASGAHSITASYSGSSTFAASVSPLLAQAVNPGADFTLSGSPSSQSVRLAKARATR